MFGLNLPYQYAYLTGCAILAVFWLWIFWARPDLRREMLWASFLGLPFGLVDYLLVPRYWHPDSLFGLMKNYGVGPESFIFFFLMAGLAAVTYEFFRRRKTIKTTGRQYFRYAPFLAGLAVFCLLFWLWPGNAVYELMAASAIGALATVYFRPDLWGQMAASAFIFSLIYFLVLFLVSGLFPGLIQNFYDLKNTWGILALGVPLEEVVVAFFAGAFWSTFYEFAGSYRVKKL